jgi:tight adherence protein C
VPLYVYIAASGVVASLFIFRWALSGNNTRSATAARRNLGLTSHLQKPVVTRQPGAASRLLDRLPLIGKGEQLQRRILIAGLSWRAGSVQFFRLAVISISLLGAALIATASGTLNVALFFVLFGVVIAFAPTYIIKAKADERQIKLEEQLPDILDRLKITLEAGLGFDSALANVVHARSGPAYDEFKRVLQDLQLGVPRDEALQALSDRTTITDLRIVVAAIVQSGKYGLPLVEVLRVQTEELRDKRWQRAQERALKIPVKILFPLILCIMPAFFVVLVGPSVITLLTSL